MSVSIEVVEPKLFAGAVADELSASLAEAIAERGSASIALAGGGTPGATYRLLALPPRVGEIEWEKVNIFWGDERFVPREDAQSNYRLVRETLLDSMPARSPRVFAIDVTAPSPEQAAALYAAQIRQVLGAPPGQIPVFDIVMLGVGVDGHTASLFPGSPLISDAADICAAVARPDGPPRVTLTPCILFAARRILFLARSEKKADIVRQVLEGGDPAEVVPARMYERAAERVTWFIDSGAARKLSHELLNAQGSRAP